MLIDKNRQGTHQGVFQNLSKNIFKLQIEGNRNKSKRIEIKQKIRKITKARAEAEGSKV